MFAFIAESECLSEWRAIILLQPMDPTSRPDPIRANRALEMADKLYFLFLHEKNPFSTSLRCVLANRFSLKASDIAELGRRYRTLRGLASIY
jgi:hypothetical protein